MLRLRCIHWFMFALVAAACPGFLRAGSLEKVWEVDLKKALHDQYLGPDQSYKVQGLAFSPDARQIVVLLQGVAVLLQVQDPKTVFGTFPSGPFNSFGWSPDSKVIHTGEHIVHLSDRKDGELPKLILFTAFMGNGDLIAMYLNFASMLPNGKVDLHPPRAADIRFYDENCQEQDTWEVPGNWLIMDASPGRGLLSVWEDKPGGRTEMIVSPSTKKVLRSRSVGFGTGGWLRFADNGNAICGGNTCWEVDTGKKIGEALVSGGISKAATRSSRVVLDDGATREFRSRPRSRKWWPGDASGISGPTKKLCPGGSSL